MEKAIKVDGVSVNKWYHHYDSDINLLNISKYPCLYHNQQYWLLYRSHVLGWVWLHHIQSIMRKSESGLTKLHNQGMEVSAFMVGYEPIIYQQGSLSSDTSILCWFHSSRPVGFFTSIWNDETKELQKMIENSTTSIIHHPSSIKLWWKENDLRICDWLPWNGPWRDADIDANVQKTLMSTHLREGNYTNMM